MKTTTPTSTILCPTCGAGQAPGGPYCKECGAEMTKQPKRNWTPWAFRDRRNFAIWGVITVAGLVYFFGGFDTLFVKAGISLQTHQCYTNAVGGIVCCGPLSPTRNDPLCHSGSSETSSSGGGGSNKVLHLDSGTNITEPQLRAQIDATPALCSVYESMQIYAGTDDAQAMAIVRNECSRLGQ